MHMARKPESKSRPGSKPIPDVQRTGPAPARAPATAPATAPASAPGELTAGAIKQAAAAGIAAPSGPLPYAEEIQRAFGRHDLSGVQAHVGQAASASARAMSAQAYATGSHIVFDGAPDLRTAAHEAAHIVQQKAGVQVTDGVGREGDRYEQHAEAVAARVAAGQSAEQLLDGYAGSGSPSAPVQRQVTSQTIGALTMYYSSYEPHHAYFSQEDAQRRDAELELINQYLTAAYQNGIYQNHSHQYGDFTYDTDQWARVTQVEGYLSASATLRNATLTGLIEDRGDHSGHIIGAEFGGPNAQINMVGMTRFVNNSETENSAITDGSYRRIERWIENRMATYPNNDLHIQVTLQYPGVNGGGRNAFRPNAVTVVLSDTTTGESWTNPQRLPGGGSMTQDHALDNRTNLSLLVDGPLVQDDPNDGDFVMSDDESEMSDGE
jgi:hypothetical protein